MNEDTSNDAGRWLCSAVSGTVEKIAAYVGRPLRLAEIQRIAQEIADLIKRDMAASELIDVAPNAITLAEADRMLSEALRKGADPRKNKAAKVNRGLSDTPGAIRARRFRRRRKQRLQFVAVPVELSERDIDGLEAAGHLDTRIERDDPVTAYRHALQQLIEMKKAIKGSLS